MSNQHSGCHVHKLYSINLIKHLKVMRIHLFSQSFFRKKISVFKMEEVESNVVIVSQKIDSVL